MKNFFLSLLLLFLILAGLLFLAKDWLIKEAFASAVRALTGFDTQVEGLSLDPGQAILHIRNLVLFNPPGFEERVFADVPEIYLQIDLPALLHKESTHLRELRLDIREFNIEKNRSRISNISLLSSVKKSQPNEVRSAAPAPKKAGMPFYLDRLELTLRRVRYHDRSGLVPKKLSVDLHVEKQVFKGISDPKSIINIILMKVITTTPFGNLGINPAEIQDQLKNSVNTARELGGKVLEETQARLAEKSSLVGKKILDEGTETASQVGSTAKEEITNLFGKLRSKLARSDGSGLPDRAADGGLSRLETGESQPK